MLPCQLPEQTPPTLVNNAANRIRTMRTILVTIRMGHSMTVLIEVMEVPIIIAEGGVIIRIIVTTIKAQLQLERQEVIKEARAEVATAGQVATIPIIKEEVRAGITTQTIQIRNTITALIQPIAAIIITLPLASQL